ncbi:MAG TPA: alpha-glucosidase/alpha-galactosidase [Candidatus Lokiarchaeia archaeon]|nr:alpha-glucosidase/alpha-galactosidase [Candidatus Lokiarchaeia archaeon]
MVKIAFIGAGSIVFAKRLIKDLIAQEKLRKQGFTMCLEDIDEHRLDLMHQYMEKYKEDNAKELENIEFEVTTNQRDAITDAKYIISVIQVGGLDAYKIDLEIPLKYGVSQCVGDSMGPGGMFRGLRTMVVFDTIIQDMKEVGYNAGVASGAKPLFLNYTNPMAANTWLCNARWPGSTVGLCHGVQGTSEELRRYVGATEEEFSFFCAGINHMAWFLEVWFKDSTQKDSKWQNGYPIIWEHFKDEPEIMGGEKVRWDMMKATGYYMTESSGHFSEYLPYYRKREDLLLKYKGAEQGFDSLQHAAYYDGNVAKASMLDETFEKDLASDRIALENHPSSEYGSHIINALETNVPFRFNGNVLNTRGSFITNLPADCCVEVPIFADYHGLHPQGGIELPTVCQALCTSNIMVQKATVEGFIEKSREKIYHAILLDPNTASVCSPEEIRSLVDDLFEAEAKWLPGF